MLGFQRKTEFPSSIITYAYYTLIQTLQFVTVTLMRTFFQQDLGFFPLLPDAPFVGESDIGQEFAYMCKLPVLPTGTSKGLLHFVQTQKKYTSHKILVSEKTISKTRYAIHTYLRRHIQKKCPSQKMSQGTVPTRRTKKGAVMPLLPSHLQNHLEHISFFHT